jgi:hypothetical protein
MRASDYDRFENGARSIHRRFLVEFVNGGIDPEVVHIAEMAFASGLSLTVKTIEVNIPRANILIIWVRIHTSSF